MRGLLSVLAACLSVLPAYGKYSGGTGEPNDPYQIATGADLIALGETSGDYDKHFILTADIDLDPNRPGGKVFDKAVIAPRVGDGYLNPPGTDFTGNFDGKGHTIKNLTISGGARGYLGLFGYVWNGGRIRNVCLENAHVTGAKGSSCVGSLVGANYEGIIDSCYVIAGVSGAEESTAIAGLIGSNQGIVTYCYALGSVSVGKSGSSAGGLAGANGGQITQCYASVAVSGLEMSTKLAGFVGDNWGSVSDSFWNVETSGLSESDGGIGLTTAQMQDPNTFIRAGWVFVDMPDSSGGIWARAVGGGFPILWWQLPESQRPQPPAFSGGTGQPGDPYLISTAGQLNAIAGDPRLMNAHFKLIADIDLKGAKIPAIGSKVVPFTGVFDGNSHAISDFTPVSTDTDCAGLFAYLGGEVRNLGLIAPHVDTRTAWFVGALAGRLDEGTITNCYAQDSDVAGLSKGEIHGDLSIAGGLVGTSTGTIVNCRVACSVFGSVQAGGLVGINSGTIINCTSSGPVSGNKSAGGLVGMNDWDGEITRCSATGDVLAKGQCVGGLVGDNTARIVNSCARGNVSGERRVGGLVGSDGYIQREDLYYEAPGEIINSYSTGAVSGTADVGGLVGFHEVGPVIASFWDIETSGRIASATGAGETTAKMQTVRTFLDARWDFVGETANGTEDIWWIDEGKDYPRLWWERYGGGRGTADDPYRIVTAADLISLGGRAEDYDRHFVLTADIDFDPNLPGGRVFDRAVIAPDVNDLRYNFQGTPFTGTFDGGGHAIHRLAIADPNHDCLGLFGMIAAGGRVGNLDLVDARIAGGHGSINVGTLAGCNAGTLEACSATGVAIGCGNVRELAGSNSGTITNCHADVRVSWLCE